MAINAPAFIEVFQDLTLWLGNRPPNEVGDALAAQAAPPWRRAPERETHDLSHAEAEYFAFERGARDDLSNIGLVLWKEPDRLHVTNIVPIETGQLSHKQYNVLVQDFSNQVAAPVAARLGLKLEISPATETLTDWMSEGTAKLLHRFSSLANKSTGSGHPMDRDRWLAFVIAAHKESGKAGYYLERWLVEVEHWPPEAAMELAIEYEFGLDLLKKYDQHTD